MLKQQVSLDKVMDVVADNRQDAYLARTGAGFTLIDQRSKLQIGTIQLNLEAVDLPGIGKMYLWGEAGFMVSGSGTILHADPVSGSVDTVFNELTFPEFIVNYIPWPADPNLLLIATKRYPVQKDGNVWFSKEVNGKTVYDGTKNCRLLLFDTRSRKTVGSTKISHAITCFANETLNGKLLAGTFDGDVLEINDSLTAQVAYHAFDRPVHSVARQKEMIVAVPHIDRQLIASYGDGRLCFYNTITKGKKDIVLPVQTPLQPSTSGINALPNNRVRRIFSLPSENSILVNYGFRGLLRISLPILDTTHYSQSAIDEINYYCFNRDSTQLLGVTMQEASIFGSSGELEAYDLKQQKFQSPFNKPAVTEQYKRLHKLYDRAGNYHFIGQKTGSGQDSLIIFSSNKTSPTFFVSSNEFVVNTSDTTLLLRSGSNAVLGRLHLENLDKNSYVFSVAADVNRNAEVFETLFEKQKNADGKIPWGVTRIVELQSGGYFFAGFNYVKQHTVNWVLAVDAKGNSLFHLEGLDKVINLAFFIRWTLKQNRL
ncbi:MAG: hypothetical protein EON98_03000 [Chitinophagaceae bacterium]|nr:MAG: hypothetical protein EON98_03000 [Chitinophagaceae bacterium]